MGIAFACTGKYAAARAQTVCTSCPDGATTEDVGADAAEDCKCQTGFGCDPSGLVCTSGCSQCGEGKFKAVIGNQVCVNCEAGKYLDAVGATSNGSASSTVRSALIMYSDYAKDACLLGLNHVFRSGQCKPCGASFGNPPGEGSTSPLGSISPDSCMCSAGMKACLFVDHCLVFVRITSWAAGVMLGRFIQSHTNWPLAMYPFPFPYPAHPTNRIQRRFLLQPVRGWNVQVDCFARRMSSLSQ